LSVPLSRGSAAIWAEWSEKNIVILGNGVEGWFPLKFEDEVLLDFLRGPASRNDLDFCRFRPEVVLDRADEAAGVAFDMFWEGRHRVSVKDNGVF
jgi:hypothetical protein